MITMVALPDGRLVGGGCDGIVRVWDTHTCLPPSCSGVVGMAKLEGHTDRVRGMTLLPDGRLVTIGNDRVRVWQLGRNDALRVL